MGVLIVNPVILNLTKICFGYPGGPMILDHLNFHIHAEDRVGLVAPNGSGKTTLFHVAMGLLKPISGTIEAFGKIRETEKLIFLRSEGGSVCCFKTLTTSFSVQRSWMMLPSDL
jgi:ABC-type cobalamin/Fe3+-siderophores transport system ATPase subunit